MRGRLLIAAVAVVAALALAGGGAYVYFFSGLRTSPNAPGLSTPSAAASGTAATSSDLTGTWKVATGSLAEYRVKELFVGETSKHVAVADTPTVSGGFTVNRDSSGYQASAITITAVLTDLHSVDSVAGRNVAQRDGFVARQMNLQQFPNATFTATSAAVAGTDTSQPVNVTIPGKLTIHGVTRDVTASGKAQVTNGKIEIAGSVSILMTDYGVTPPSVPFTTVDPQVTIDFHIFLARAS